MNRKVNIVIKKLKNQFSVIVCLLLAFLVLSSHDLYLKMETYFLKPNHQASVSLYNGTFEKSENIITRDRMLDASIVANGERAAINPDQWTDQDSTITKLNFNTGEAGTYVIGVSTKARNIELTADKFNSYLEHDGVLDMLQYRTDNGLLDQDAVESYQKHVKAIYQVGDVKSDDWKTVLGYPIEFVPLANPYDKYSGDKLEVQLLLNGQPLSNQLVLADFISSSSKGAKHGHSHEHDGEEHTHEHNHDSSAKHHADDSEHTHMNGQQLRTDNRGVVEIDLLNDGIYFLRTIHMINVTEDPELTHISKWATLTFEVSHKHGTDTHTHDHHHDEGFPTWMSVLASLFFIAVLFLIFRK